MLVLPSYHSDTLNRNPMKKLILIAFVLSGSIAFGQFTPRASLDYFPRFYTRTVFPVSAATRVTEGEALMDYGNFRVRLGATYTYKIASVYFDQHVYMTKGRNVAFKPIQAEWYAGMKVKIYKGLTVGYEHACIHPVLCDGSYQSRTKVYGGYNMFSISYGY